MVHFVQFYHLCNVIYPILNRASPLLLRLPFGIDETDNRAHKTKLQTVAENRNKTIELHVGGPVWP